MTPTEAAQRLDEIHSEIEKTGTTKVSLRERLDLYYAATGTTAQDYEYDDE